MSLECGDCERDLRGPHDSSCKFFKPPHKPTSVCVNTCDNPSACHSEYDAWVASNTLAEIKKSWPAQGSGYGALERDIVWLIDKVDTLLALLVERHNFPEYPMPADGDMSDSETQSEREAWIQRWQPLNARIDAEILSLASRTPEQVKQSSHSTRDSTAQP